MNKNSNYEASACFNSTDGAKVKVAVMFIEKYRKLTQRIECYTFSTAEWGKLALTAKLGLFQCLDFLFISDEARQFIILYSPLWQPAVF